MADDLKSISVFLKNNTDKSKVSIGYQTSGYDRALKVMQDAQEEKVRNGTEIGINTVKTTVETISTVMGSWNLDDTAVDQDGFYSTSTKKMAAVMIYPVESFTYSSSDNKICGGEVPAPTKAVESGQTAQNKKNAVPSLMNKSLLEALEDGEFSIGIGVDLSSTFATKYLEKFGEGKITLKELSVLAAKGLLCGEVFFPAETSGSSAASIFVGKIIYNIPQEQPMVSTDGQTTFWKCYVPVPVMLLDDYKSFFSVSANNTEITNPSYTSSATYNYETATISGYTKAGLVQQEEAGITTSTVSITKWPSVSASGGAVFGRFRFFIRKEELEAAKQELASKDVPEAFIGLTDETIRKVIQKEVVQGANTQSTFDGSMTIWYDGTVLNLQNYIDQQAWNRAWRFMAGMETGNADMPKANIVKGDGPEADFVSWGPCQFCGGTLVAFLVNLGMDKSRAQTLARGKSGETSQFGSAAGEKTQIHKEITDFVYSTLGNDNNRVIYEVTKFWWSDKGSDRYAGVGYSYGGKAILWYNYGRFSQKCPLAFAMCMYMSNQGTVFSGGNKKFMQSLSGTDAEKCEQMANAWTTANDNYKAIKRFWQKMAQTDSVSFVNTINTVNLHDYNGQAGIV